MKIKFCPPTIPKARKLFHKKAFTSFFYFFFSFFSFLYFFNLQEHEISQAMALFTRNSWLYLDSNLDGMEYPLLERLYMVERVEDTKAIYTMLSRVCEEMCAGNYVYPEIEYTISQTWINPQNPLGNKKKFFFLSFLF